MNNKLLCELSKADLVFNLWREYCDTFNRIEKRIRSPQSLLELRNFGLDLLRLYQDLEK